MFVSETKKEKEKKSRYHKYGQKERKLDRIGSLRGENRWAMTAQRCVGCVDVCLGSNDDALSPGGLLVVDVFVFRGALGAVVAVAATCAAAVELDSVARSRDAVPLARAAAASRGNT